MTARALLFDLDDTLFAEESFVRSGYAQVAAAASAAGAGESAAALLDRLWYDFRRLGRTGAFDRFAAAHPGSALSVAEMVKLYREHRPTIALDDPARRALAVARANGLALALVTDGAAATQARKVEALGVAPLVDAVVYTWALEAPKPDPRGFLEACARLGVAPAQAVVVGDDPYHDVEAARRAGLAMIRLRSGRAAEIETRDRPALYAEIDTLDALPEALTRLGLTQGGAA